VVGGGDEVVVAVAGDVDPVVVPVVVDAVVGHGDGLVVPVGLPSGHDCCARNSMGATAPAVPAAQSAPRVIETTRVRLIRAAVLSVIEPPLPVHPTRRGVRLAVE
ncbi:MAG: hypothetical protein M3238_07530, partial [Actinomycetota bacterium]|nr:hypothetical protein [Actinomycetota bacterium]